MNSRMQFAASILSLGTLLGGLGSAQATNVTKMPLNAAVLAKPNVIFAQDDSGSMDWEFMLSSNDGIPMWDYQNARGVLNGDVLRSGGNGHWGYYYLFPNGSGTGNRLYADPANSYGYAMPPTAQLAWTRNKDFNTLFYNPYVTYEPWASGIVSGTSYTFSNASPSAAKSHPLNGNSTYQLNANLNVNADGWRFSFMAGMTIPAGAVVRACLNGGIPANLPHTVTAGQVGCSASMSFYPATYWMKVGEPGVASCTVDNVACVWAPNGTDRLRRFEIKSGNTFPSGRSYADEMQNFANWFTYYRKRRLMLGGAMGAVLEGISGVRMGVVNFNDRQPVTMFDADSATASTGRQRVIGEFYTPERQAGTPTRETLLYIGQQFRRTDTDTLGNKIVQFACQRNNAFVVTDGFANPSSVSVPSYNRSLYAGSAPYTQLFDGSLADIAAAYYTNNLRSDLGTGKVPLEDAARPNADRNPNLHMNTFGLTLGLKGFQWPDTVDPFANPPTWASPSTQTRVQIDDLWHATITGRGKMYLASTPEQTALQIQAGLTEMQNVAGSQSGVAVSSVNLTRGDGKAYLATYNPAGWAGDVKAHAIHPSTGAVADTATWSAASLLAARDWTTRVIATSNGSSGVGFTAANVGSTINPSNAFGNTNDIMDYLRGDRSKEGATFRTRVSLLGAVINAEPTVDNGVVFAASGEGMLHAFETSGADAGKELWAFVPRAVLPNLGETSKRGYTFITRLDGSPVVASVGSTKLLVAGLGTAGRSYYALDVTSPRGLNESDLAGKVKWEFPGASDTTTQAKMGLAMGKPAVVKTSSNGTVVLVTSGYNNTHDGKGRLWMLNSSTGAVIKEFATSVGSLASEAGLAQVSPFGEADGTVRYVYGGDLLGNVWRFDLNAATGSAPVRIATLQGPANDVQPVTAAPELLLIEDKRVVVVGTGRLLDSSDFGDSKVQTLYAIADTAGSTTLYNARTALVQQVHDRGTNSMSSNTVNWATQRGWYLDLSGGEQITTRPLSAYNAIGFVTNRNGISDCSAQSYFYWLTIHGHRVSTTATVSSEISASANAARLLAVLTTDGVRFVRRTNDGKSTASAPLPAPTILPSKNAWREVRR